MTETGTAGWVLYRCWAGVASTMEPQETRHRFSDRQSAEECADRLTAGIGGGTWFEVRRAAGERQEQ